MKPVQQYSLGPGCMSFDLIWYTLEHGLFHQHSQVGHVAFAWFKQGARSKTLRKLQLRLTAMPSKKLTRPFVERILKQELKKHKIQKDGLARSLADAILQALDEKTAEDGIAKSKSSGSRSGPTGWAKWREQKKEKPLQPAKDPLNQDDGIPLLE